MSGCPLLLLMMPRVCCSSLLSNKEQIAEIMVLQLNVEWASRFHMEI